MALIPHFYMEAVVSIGVRNENTINWIGTGFFVVKPINDNEVQPFMVTNRHVLQGEKSVVIRLKEKNSGDLRVIDMPLENNEKLLYSIHDDEQVDIAVVLINGSFLTENNLQFSAFNTKEHLLESYELKKQGVEEGSYVFMLGFPMGLVNVDSNAPICRGGCIARFDEKEINSTKQFLLDIQNFPGNSGSPIITKPEVIGFGNSAFKKSVLIGIVFGYKPYIVNAINAQTNKVEEIRRENSGIAVVNPAEFILQVIEKEMNRRNNIPQ